MNVKEWNSNYKIAASICALLFVWMLLGLLPDNEDKQKQVVTPEKKAFTVKAKETRARTFQRPIVIRGLSRANRSVDVAAEVSGQVTATPVEEGALVSRGAVLCELASEDRQLRLKQAQAQLSTAQIEYEGALSLKDRGYQSQTQIATAKANLALAKANVSAAELAVNKLKVRAPFDGVVDRRLVEAGAFLPVGGACATMLELSPLVVTGQVSESDVLQISLQQPAEMRFLDGGSVQGVITYISSAADPVTRGFRVDVSFDNAGLRYKQGMSAKVVTYAQAVNAHYLSPSLLSLLTDGHVGIKVIENGNQVAQYPVDIIGDDEDGVWVTGLKDDITLITLGHEYVSQGMDVQVTLVKSENNVTPEGEGSAQ